MTISGERTEQLNIFCRITGFTSDFLSFIDMELIRFFHGALQLVIVIFSFMTWKTTIVIGRWNTVDILMLMKSKDFFTWNVVRLGADMHLQTVHIASSHWLYCRKVEQAEQCKATGNTLYQSKDYEAATRLYTEAIGTSPTLLYYVLSSAAYCNQSCLWLRVCVRVCLWDCYHDKAKLRALIFTKLGL